MRPAVLMTGNPQPVVRERLTAAFDVVTLPQVADAAAVIGADGSRIRAVASSGHQHHGAALFDLLPNLEIVAHFGVGYDPVDSLEAGRRGIVVTNTPDVLTEEVADTALGLLLMTVRELSEAERWLRAGRWESEGPYPLTPGSLVGRSLGILGLGRIGRTVARRAAGFDMAVRYHNRHPVADVPWTHEPSLLALAAWADFLVVIAAGGSETRHLVDARVLDALGPQGFLVNVARGSVIDEAALVQALTEGRIAGAGLDVFENEPEVPAALFGLDNVVLLPHIASGTVETRRAMGDRVADNLDAWFRDGRLVSAAPLP